MIHKITGWMHGYIVISVKGAGCKRFVNLCHNHNIELWKIRSRKSEDEIVCFIFLSDFYKVKPIVRKCRVFVKVTEVHGMPFVLQKMRKRASFFAGVILCFFLVLFLSGRIWGIDIQGQKHYTREMLLEYLDSKSVYGGMAVSDVDCAGIREDMRHDFQDIGWVSVKLQGSRLRVSIKEIQLVNEDNKPDKKRASIIAEEPGYIVSIVTSAGTPKVRKGDKVKKGRVLISGLDKIYDDSREVMKKRKIYAMGDVVLQSTENYTDNLKETYINEEYTGNTKTIYKMNIFDKSFYIHNPFDNLDKYEKYDVVNEEKHILDKLSERVPVFFENKRYLEIKSSQERYNKEEAEKILQKRFANYLEELKDKGYTIKEGQIKVTKSQQNYIAEGRIVKEKKQEMRK